MELLNFRLLSTKNHQNLDSHFCLFLTGCKNWKLHAVMRFTNSNSLAHDLQQAVESACILSAKLVSQALKLKPRLVERRKS